MKLQNRPTTPQPRSAGLQPQAAPQLTQPVTEKRIPFYRMYWTFGAIYLILTPIIGLVILFTGDIYRKQKDGQLAPIRKREKITLTIVAILLWAYLVLRPLAGSQ